MVTEAEARQIIGQSGAAELVDIVRAAWHAHLDEGRTRRRRTRAGIVWEYMVDLATARFQGANGVETVMLAGDTPAFVLRDRILLRLKMHDRDLMTRNIRTRTQARLDALGHFDELPALAHVTCGYVLDHAEADVEQVVAVRRVDGDIEWWIDLEELAAGNFEPVAPILPDFPDPAFGTQAPLPIIVRPTQEEEEEKET